MKKLLVFLLALALPLSACATNDEADKLAKENEALKAKLAEEKKNKEEKSQGEESDINNQEEIVENDPQGETVDPNVQEETPDTGEVSSDIGGEKPGASGDEKPEGVLVTVEEVPFTVKDITSKYGKETDVAFSYKNDSKYSIVDYRVTFVNTSKNEDFYASVYNYTTKPGTVSMMERSSNAGKAEDLKAMQISYSVYDGSDIYDVRYDYELDSYEVFKSFRGVSKDNEVKASEISYEILPANDGFHNFKVAVTNNNTTPLTSVSLHFRDKKTNESVYTSFYNTIGAGKKSTYDKIYSDAKIEDLELYRVDYSYLKDGNKVYVGFDNILGVYFD